MTTISGLIDRPRRHWMEDGVVDLMFGIQWLVTGLILWVGQTIPRGPSFGVVYSMPATMLWIGAAIVSIWGVVKLKERLIAPRAGYVTLKGETSQTGISCVYSVLILSIALLIGVAGLTIPIAEHEGWGFGAGVAGFLALCFLWAAVADRMPRYLLLVGLAAGWGEWIFLFQTPLERATAMIPWLGGGWALLGAVRLVGFLKANPPIEAGE